MTISDNQFEALHNLAEKKSGKPVPWINISDALALTGLGLARRIASGWEITLEGACLLQDRPGAPDAPSATIPFRRSAL